MSNYKTKINYKLCTHFTDDDLYKFTMCAAIMNTFPEAKVVYKFQDRENKVYPEGFVEELKQQIEFLKNLKITEEEISFMKSKCYYIPYTFYDYLRGFKFFDGCKFDISQDAEGHLHMEFGYSGWANVIFGEVKLLAIINRLYYLLTNQSESDKGIDYVKYYKYTYNKAIKMFENNLSFAEFGTRRRYSFKAQDIAVCACKNASIDCGKLNLFKGTSNVYLAMKYNLTPIGTMAHEYISGIAGIYGSPVEANHIAMREWERTYNGALGIYLYDTYGIDMFKLNFSDKYARSFDGLRIDSGDNFEQYCKIMDIYKQHRVNGENKLIMFSNALTTDSYIELGKKLRENFENPTFSAGIGTHLTNDFINYGVKPCNNVIKLIKIAVNDRRNYLPTCKLSNDSGKYIAGDNRIADAWKYLISLNID